MSGLHSFIEEQKAVTFPEKSFDLGRRSSTEQKQRIGNKKGHLIFLLDDGGKGINAIAKICVAADNVDAGEVVRVSIFNAWRTALRRASSFFPDAEEPIVICTSP